MTLRDMTPDEMELFEAENVQRRDEAIAGREADEGDAVRRRPSGPDVVREDGEGGVDGDGDGLPDGPVERRVPS